MNFVIKRVAGNCALSCHAIVMSCHAMSCRVQGNVAANPALGIPPLNLNDGPQGFRGQDDGTSTCWPSGLTMAATWDVNLMHAWGVAMGQEFAAKGAWGGGWGGGRGGGEGADVSCSHGFDGAHNPAVPAASVSCFS